MDSVNANSVAVPMASVAFGFASRFLSSCAIATVSLASLCAQRLSSYKKARRQRQLIKIRDSFLAKTNADYLRQENADYLAIKNEPINNWQIITILEEEEENFDNCQYEESFNYESKNIFIRNPQKD